MKKLVITAAALCVSAGLFAQNLNPVVEVTNTYAREASGIEKPTQLLAVPDSVYSFNLDMDYSVRNTPYQAWVRAMVSTRRPPWCGRLSARGISA